MEHNVVYIGNDRCKLYVGSSRRCVVTESAALPYDAEIEFIESTGTQWIGTGIVPNFSTTVEVKAAAIEDSLFHTVSARTTSDNNGRYFTFSYSTNQQARNVMASSQYTFQYFFERNPHVVIFNEQNTHNCYFDGTLQRTLTSGNTVSQQNQLTMFGTSGYGSDCADIGYVKIYYVKITVDGILVRDYIPVRIGQTGYMYDKVSGQLYGNNGSGDFVLGQDKGILPYDAEIEYLESTGTQYIDTGVLFNSACTISTTVIMTPTNAEFDILGNANTQGTYSGKMVLGVYNGFIFFFNNPNTRVDSQTFSQQEAQFDISMEANSNGRTLTVNGSSYTKTGATYKNEGNIALFRGGTNYNLWSSVKLKSFTMSKEGNTIRDMIPVRVGTTGYMYDKVSGELFGNDGTGTFILGPDKT